MSYSSVQ